MYEIPTNCNLSVEALLLIVDCLQYNVESRISMENLLKHPFLAQSSSDEDKNAAPSTSDNCNEEVSPAFWYSYLLCNEGSLLFNSKDATL